MKKLSVFVLAVTAAVLTGGVNLHIDGKFRQVEKGLPVQWQFSPAGTGKIVGGEEWFSKALELSAAKTAVTAASKRTFPVSINDKVEIEAEIKGRGSAFFVVELLDTKGKVVAAPRVAVQEATHRFRDMKGVLRVRDYAQLSPAAVRIVLGAEADSIIVFDDVDAELDRD